MKYYSIFATGLLVLLAIATPATAKKPAQVEAFSCNNYALDPPFLADAVAPSTTLIVDSSGSMNEHAYREFEVSWKETSTSTSRRAFKGYDETNSYYGFFDTKSYYSYTSADGGYFYIDSTGSWSGNFLNWAAMHRTDIVRKAHTGGPYNTITGTYKVSRTDGTSGSQYRGMYHVYDTASSINKQTP